MDIYVRNEIHEGQVNNATEMGFRGLGVLMCFGLVKSCFMFFCPPPLPSSIIFFICYSNAHWRPHSLRIRVDIKCVPNGVRLSITSTFSSDVPGMVASFD